MDAIPTPVFLSDKIGRNYITSIGIRGNMPEIYIGTSINGIFKKKGKDIVYGSRFLADSETDISFIRHLGNKFFFLIGNLLYRKKTDFLSGFFAIKKDKFLELNLKSNGFEIETEIFIKAVKKRLKIGEVPIKYTRNGDSKLNPLKDGLPFFLKINPSISLFISKVEIPGFIKFFI